MCEVFKSLHRTNPEFMWNLFKPKHLEKNLRKPTLLQLPSPKSKSKGHKYITIPRKHIVELTTFTLHDRKINFYIQKSSQ